MENKLDFFNNYIMAIIQMLTGFHYYTKFMKKKVHFTAYMLFGALGMTVITVVSIGGMYSFMAYVLMLMVWGLFVYKTNVMSGVLYAVVIGEIMQLCYGMFDSILSILASFLHSYPLQIVSMALMILGNMAVVAVIYCCRMVYRYFAQDELINGQYAVLILLPTLLIFLVSEYINFAVYGNVTIDNSGNVINANHVQMLVIQLLGIGSLFSVMATYKKLLENVRFSTELSLLRQQEYFLNQYVEEAKTRYEHTKSFRHDIKNHITVVSELLQSGKWKQALDYVGDMEEMTAEMSFPYSTNNPVVDILLGNKLGIAKSNEIEVDCSLALPYPCPIRDIDFCIILSNALDNAICACKNIDKNIRKDTGKYIHVTGNIQGDFVLIEVENSFDIKQMFEEGTGLSNIRKVAEKYHGAVSVRIEEKAVLVSVLLIIS